MKIIETRSELQDWSDRQRADGRRIALVPTMGALHAGHLSLVTAARERADRVIVSIFVNPTQFNDPRDFEGYPRVMDADLAACREAGVDVVWTPAADELYPQHPQHPQNQQRGAASSATWVDVEGLTEPLCGSNRPGHFRGVTTIVTKLFLAARPHVAVFGEKDFQQLAVIRRMTADLGFGIEIVGGRTVREHDGLALSSRNVRLGRNARRQALVISRSLALAESMVAQGERSHATILEAVRKRLDEATQASIDYADLRDPDSLLPAPETLDGPALLAIALQFEADDIDDIENADNTEEAANPGSAVRLIDNRVLNPRK
jgi:pantoate--beta-alanine ligase